MLRWGWGGVGWGWGWVGVGLGGWVGVPNKKRGGGEEEEGFNPEKGGSKRPQKANLEEFQKK